MAEPRRDKQQEMLDAFYDLFADTDPDTVEEINEIIQSAGIDPETYAAEINKLAQETINERVRDEIETARQQYERTKSLEVGERHSIIQRIQALIAHVNDQGHPALAHHRNLESASDADLQSLLDDLTYLSNSPDFSEQE
ncbi:MAG: hypothetical protein MN733_38220 [Nitrososphaera sp.]|nr:hypothetical protein [Nitrososphaera sp.]